MLTVAVSVSSGAQYAASAIPALRGHEVDCAPSSSVLVLMAINLRGVRESGTAFAIPTYAFMFAIIGMAPWGLCRYFFGDLPDVAESAGFELAPEPAFEARASPGSPARSCCCARSPPAARR